MFKESVSEKQSLDEIFHLETEIPCGIDVAFKRERGTHRMQRGLKSLEMIVVEHA
jgi:hypothetical protein